MSADVSTQAGISLQWEYKMPTGYNQLTGRALNDIEAEGWEVVGVTSHTETIRIAGA